MMPLRTDSPLDAPRRPFAFSAHGRRAVRSVNPTLNTLDQVLAFTRSYSKEIRQDTKSRRIYKSFLALTQNQFEALLAFSLWKVRGLAVSLP